MHCRGCGGSSDSGCYLIATLSSATQYFHVLALSNGAFMLEPRVLVPPHAISARSLKMLEKSAANLKKGIVSQPIDLTPFQKGRQQGKRI